MEITYDELPNEYVLNMKKQLDIDNLNPLTNILQEHKCVIAGSYVLQTVCGENWANDIDIWCSASPDSKSIVSDIEKLGYRLVKNMDHTNPINLIKQQKLYKIDKMLNEEKLTKIDIDFLQQTKKYWENYHETENILSDIEEYRRLKNHVVFIYFLLHDTKPPIQVIEVKNIMNCIATFDFNICQVYYDGENIFAKNAFKKAGFLACIKYRIGKITYEASVIQTAPEWYRTLRRALKYTQRGFFIDFTQAYPFLKEKIHKDDWNNIVCGNCRDQLKNVGRNNSKNFKIVKTLKLPYFHTYIQSRHISIFGYNVNPYNKMNSIIKGLMKGEVFRVNSKTTNSRCLNVNKVNINETQELRKIYNDDVVDAISSIYESNYNPTIRSWSRKLYNYYVNMINYVLSGTDVEVNTDIDRFIEDMLEEKEDIKKLDIENPQKIFTDFRRYIVDNGRADKYIKVEYLERIKNIAIELDKKGKIDVFAGIVFLCNRLIEILNKENKIKPEEAKCKTINFLPLFDVILKGRLYDNNFLNELFNSITQQLCSDMPIIGRELMEGGKYKTIKDIVTSYLKKNGIPSKVKKPLTVLLTDISTYIDEPITESSINKKMNQCALWGSHRFYVILTDEQRRRITEPEIDEDDENEHIISLFYSAFHGYLFGITIDKFIELYLQIPNIDSDDLSSEERRYKILEYVSKYLGIYNEELHIEIVYSVSILRDKIIFDEFKNIYERVEHTDDIMEQLDNIEYYYEENDEENEAL